MTPPRMIRIIRRAAARKYPPCRVPSSWCRVMEFDLNKVGSAPGSEKEEALENVLVATDSWS